jgi:hypothetical protein
MRRLAEVPVAHDAKSHTYVNLAHEVAARPRCRTVG